VREFEFAIDESLKNGLNPLEKIPLNIPYLSACNGFKVGKAGLEKYELLDNPLPVALEMHYSWPFPQFIAGEGYNILIVRESELNHIDYVYRVSDDHFTVNLIFAIDELTFGLGTLMEVADFGKYAFMTNGVIMIYWNVALEDWHEVVASDTIPMMHTICSFKGQAVGGNIVSDWYDCDETFYVWSKIGSIDFTPDQENEAGYRRCPYGGVVRNVRRLGDEVVGYSSKGVVLFQPTLDPATFGFKEICNVGIINQGAINGDYNHHVFLGEDYILRSVVGEEVTELGYKNYMKELQDEDVIISYDHSKKEFYIGNSTKTFLLTSNGLTEIKQHPSTVWRNNNETYMLPDAEDSEDIVIASEIFNLGFNGRKTIFSIETNALLTDSLEAGINWANDLTTFGESPYTPINDMGIASIIVAGNFFQVKLRFGNVYDDFSIDTIKVRFKMTDLRGIRGVYAPPPRGQY
jgi:hypothetical protein